MDEITTTIIAPSPKAGFVETRFIQDVSERALKYIESGFPVHFRGRAGTGKTTLAMHLASKIGRPVVLIHGDEEFTTADLVGGEYGYKVRKVVDNFIHSVLKTEEDMMKRWVDNRLTVAAKHGFTLIYDEFTRSRPEANNILLSILEENILDLPAARGGNHYLRVHPNFRAIFTSNPEEYAGTHETQDALRDRMITLDLGDFDEETEICITASSTGLSKKDAKKIVSIARSLRNSDICEFAPTVRTSIMIAKTTGLQKIHPDASNPLFRQICMDIFTSQTMRYGPKRGDNRIRNLVEGFIDKYCSQTKSRPKQNMLANKEVQNA